jgi:hypothetical protein
LLSHIFIPNPCTSLFADATAVFEGVTNRRVGVFLADATEVRARRIRRRTSPSTTGRRLVHPVICTILFIASRFDG